MNKRKVINDLCNKFSIYNADMVEEVFHEGYKFAHLEMQTFNIKLNDLVKIKDKTVVYKVNRIVTHQHGFTLYEGYSLDSKGVRFCYPIDGLQLATIEDVTNYLKEINYGN